MNKITTKIYRIDSSHHEDVTPGFFIEKLIEQHNVDTSVIRYDPIETKIESEEFCLKLFIHNPPHPSKPNWHGLLMDISGNNTKVKNIGSKYPSFILFFYSETEIFVITGGAGYRVVERALDSQFGFKVVERLIDTSNDDIRGLSQRVFLGVELASNRFFKADYAFEDEDNFGKYYRGLDVFINSQKLKNIGVETKKKSLLVRGELGFKIDTKISFDELLERIKSISTLLKEVCEIELNPFKKLTRWELKRSIRKDKTFEMMLDQELINDYYKEFQLNDPRQIYHPSLMEYLKCSSIKVKLGKVESIIETSQPITPKLILGKLDLEVTNLQFPKFLELVKEVDVWIVEEETGNKVYNTKLYEWFYGEVTYAKKRYMKFENEWFNYSIKFSEDLNHRLDTVSNRIGIYELDKWSRDISSEAVYNDEYSNKSYFIVGDGVLHKGIEIADIISWTDDELMIIHVKDGLDRDLRVLQSQIINSAKVISELRSDLYLDNVKLYHERLVKENNKTGKKIPDLEEFIEILNKRNIRFVFAMATETENIEKEDIFREIKASKSAVAKIAILHSFYSIKDLDYHFSLSKIVKEKSI